MDLRLSMDHVVVKLSRRNLQTLLSKLDMAGSSCILLRRCDDGDLIVILRDDDGAVLVNGKII